MPTYPALRQSVQCLWWYDGVIGLAGPVEAHRRSNTVTTPSKPQYTDACRNGHPWPASAYVKKNGHRFCDVCCKKRRQERRSLALKFPERVQPVDVRFLQRINKDPGQGPWGDCWTYSGATRPGQGGRGYGQIGSGRKIIPTHRLAYELEYGPIPEGLVIMHKCDNPPCCRPDHLQAGTQAENNWDKIKKGRGPDMRVVALSRRNPWGERNGMARTSWETVRAIRAEYAAGGISMGKLAIKYDRPSGWICNVINKKLWKEQPYESRNS
jgi:hypothetical protein